MAKVEYEGHELLPDTCDSLINLEIDPSLGRSYLDQLHPSVQTYLRLLGRNTRIEKIRARFLDLTDPMEQHRAMQRISDAELAGGWYLLRLASHPRDGHRPRGIYFDPKAITPSAIRKCPQMPWIYGVRAETIYGEQERGVSVESAVDRHNYIWPQDVSPYTRITRNLTLSNAIVPLPQPEMDDTHRSWITLICMCYGRQHPLNIITNYRLVNEDDNEDLVLAVRDEELPLSLFVGPMRSLGINPARDQAYEVYVKDVMGYDSDT